MGTHTVLFSDQDSCFGVQLVFDCHLCAFLLSYRYNISLELILFLIAAKDFDLPGDCNQDFVAPALCHIPIEVVSVRGREHQHEERTPSGVVFWTAAGIVRWSERMKEFEGGRRPTNRRTVNYRRETVVQINRQNIQEPDRRFTTQGKSWHLVREEWFFHEIGTLWRSSTILNHESTTSGVNVRVQRKSENLHEVNEKKSDWSRKMWMVIANVMICFGSLVMFGKW